MCKSFQVQWVLNPDVQIKFFFNLLPCKRWRQQLIPGKSESNRIVLQRESSLLQSLKPVSGMCYGRLEWCFYVSLCFDWQQLPKYLVCCVFFPESVEPKKKCE